jgi:hypothetical protein
MHNDEFTLSIGCVDCGEWVDTSSPWFEVRHDVVLCYECAARRGGHFDSELDEWVLPPDIALLHRFLAARSEGAPRK